MKLHAYIYIRRLRNLLKSNICFLAMATGVSSFAAVPQNRTEQHFENWATSQAEKVRLFKAYLDGAGVGGVYPLYQLLRTASDWHKCDGPPFEVPPQKLWKDVKNTLLLVKALKDQGVLQGGEVVSAYRNPLLNECAGGSRKSAHMISYALDIEGASTSEATLCGFYKTQGSRLKMGLSRYSSGRLHLDAKQYRTWGDDHTRKTSFCRSYL